MVPNRRDDDQEREKRKQRFLALLEPLYVRLERFAFAVARDPEEGRDLIGETLLRAFENFDKVRDERAFLAYLFSIATRLHARRRQRGQLFERFEEEGEDVLPSTAPQPDLAADIEILYAALAQLAPRQRETIVLYEISGLPLKEIQQVQGGTMAALKVRLWRARRQLAALLGVDAGSEATSSTAARDVERVSSFPNDLQRALP